MRKKVEKWCKKAGNSRKKNQKCAQIYLVGPKKNADWWLIETKKYWTP